MPRRKRIVIPGLPHHVTQRGGRRQDVFFTNEDRRFYLKLLKDNAKRHGALILSYCLMTNHVHHLVVPLQRDSLRWTFQQTHKRYADMINGRQGWSGHLWQQRFYSSPVDDDYLWTTLRYIARNPVEAGLCRHPAEYEWSSAAAHCALREDIVLTNEETWVSRLRTRRDWIEWLSENDSKERLALLRSRTARDLPTGSEAFLNRLEQTYGVKAHPPKLGRPKKEKSEPSRF